MTYFQIFLAPIPVGIPDEVFISERNSGIFR